ncbi:cell cycle control protein 50C-like isoform X2 [Anticarsia gemmatalis]|uniref:cell cycle control protein 50C-like isoform X2 n=1 Tax=Anticarsia gemmatalis TaxID=129554 RepID=UPI003F75C4A7
MSFGFAISGILGLTIGIVLRLSNPNDVYSCEYSKDYTDCLDVAKRKCSEIVPRAKCVCFLPLEIKEPLEGEVTVFYELETFNQLEYGNSRDDEQLAGRLSMVPASSCGNYSYIDEGGIKTPIAPCGYIADSMFTDSYKIRISGIEDYFEEVRSGLIGLTEEDRKYYRNPDGDLHEAFKNFAKPKSWRMNVYELDTRSPCNNGFQNEPFIAWMKTDMKRKPAWRFNHSEPMLQDGLPANNYILRINYSYPSSRYAGRRKVIISSMKLVPKPGQPRLVGIILIYASILALLISAFLFYCAWKGIDLRYPIYQWRRVSFYKR